MTSAPGIVVIYARGEPSLCYLWHAISQHRKVRGWWCADGMDILRLATGQARFDPLLPRLLPQLPSYGRRSIGFYGPLLGRLASTFVLTAPDHATLLPHLAGKRIIYQAVDNYSAYAAPGTCRQSVLLEMEDQLLHAADRVVVVTEGLATVLAARVPAIAGRVVVSPNAVPAEWIPPQCPETREPVPIQLRALGRPIAGVLGTISGRLRLDWLCAVVERTPFLTWLFAGYVEPGEMSSTDRVHLARLKANPRCVFTGRVSYGAYRAYAGCLDVAVLPYSAQGVNPLGSAMRLFMHLPFGQPILATPGVAMLDDFYPLVRLCPTADDLAAAIVGLHEQGYEDGLRRQRWQEAQRHTWTVRADRLLGELAL